MEHLWAPTLTCKHFTNLEIPASLVGTYVNYGRKEPCNISPRAQSYKKICDRKLRIFVIS